MVLVSDADLARMQKYWRATMTQTIKLYRATDSPDQFNKYPLSQTPDMIPAHILHEFAEVFTTAGQQQVAVTTIKMPLGTGTKVGDVIELPNGARPPIISIDDAAFSDDWPLFEQVRTGKAQR